MLLVHASPFGFTLVHSKAVSFATFLGGSLGQEDSPGGGHGHPLQNACLENPMDRGAWRAAVHRVPERQMRRVTKQQLCFAAGLLSIPFPQQG